MNKPFVILFNGVPGVGKTTLAKEFAKRSKFGAYTDVDHLRHFVIGGVVGAKEQNKDIKEFERQRLLAVDNVASLAKNFLQYGFNYFIADLAKIPSVLKRYDEKFKNLNFYHILLSPSLEETIKRDATRQGMALHGAETVTKIYNNMQTIDHNSWIKIDTTEKSVDEVIGLICQRLNIDI